jgi:hypothetical protein
MSLCESFEMRFEVTKTKDGLIHVQNCVGFLRGQHHVHTKQGYRQWLRMSKAKMRTITVLKPDKCDCGLKPSEVREYDGNKWTSKDF